MRAAIYRSVIHRMGSGRSMRLGRAGTPSQLQQWTDDGQHSGVEEDHAYVCMTVLLPLTMELNRYLSSPTPSVRPSVRSSSRPPVKRD